MATAVVGAEKSPPPRGGPRGRGNPFGGRLRGARGGGVGRGAMRVQAAPEEAELMERERLETVDIDRLQLELKSLTDEIAERTKGREEFERRKTELRNSIDELTRKIAENETERKSITGQIDSRQRAGRDMRNEAMNMKMKLGFESEDDIEKKISDIERLLMTKSLTLKEEKKLVEQITKLKKSKPTVSKYVAMETHAAAFEDTNIGPLKGRSEELRMELMRLREGKKEEVDKLRELNEERQKIIAPVRELFDDRESLRKGLNEHFQARNEIRQERSDARKAMAARFAKERAERESRSREEKKLLHLRTDREDTQNELNNIEDVPFQDELRHLEQAAAYVAKLKTGSTEGKKGLATPVDANLRPDFVAEGEDVERVIPPKAEREEDCYYSGTKKSAKKGRKSPTAQTTKKKPGTIRHDFRAITDFEACGVEAPLTIVQLDECEASLARKIEEIKTKQREFTEAKKTRKKELEDKLEILEREVTEVTHRLEGEEQATQAQAVTTASED